jgi:hypothetical protein
MRISSTRSPHGANAGQFFPDMGEVSTRRAWKFTRHRRLLYRSYRCFLLSLPRHGQLAEDFISDPVDCSGKILLKTQESTPEFLALFVA